MELEPLPTAAAWQHRVARDGFEVVYFEAGPTTRMRGHAVAVEAAIAWSVAYDITIDPRGRGISARVLALSENAEARTNLEVDDRGRWRVNGAARADLDGCLDVDLEASACTNSLPIRRLGLEVSEQAAAPAVYVRAPGLDVERLEQSYRRVDDDGPRLRYDYRAPAFDFTTRLLTDGSGLVLEYPGLATRVL